MLGKLRCPMGVFAVLGNHDFSVRNALGIRRHQHLHRAVADALRNEGIRVLDASDPAHPAEFAYADTWAGPSGGYNGVWETCPFFSSGTIIATLGKEIRYLDMVLLLLEIDVGREACARPNPAVHPRV